MGDRHVEGPEPVPFLEGNCKIETPGGFPMSTGHHDEPLTESRPAEAGSAAQSRFRTILRTMIAGVLCCGVLWWTVQTVLTDYHAAKAAIRAMGPGTPPSVSAPFKISRSPAWEAAGSPYRP